ncbi:ThiF family adenylyltransferase [Lelliottia sp. SL45]|uniref:ThiF family adenylyltransferase n=1 Tax=Lelliottia sp. SL45 TaxID=2994665 RepID=UPI0022747FBB|nr:ThiF family adenylyltransferase [Lelliottia sp. SL45]MCY1697215.1 ThiF family adenylyltransferase [Lelliottia sp. SL45]
MESKKYKIKETVDIFISNEEHTDNITLTFHVMTTRDRLEIKTNTNVARFIASLDGMKTINDIITEMGSLRSKDVDKLITFLLNQNFIYDINNICDIEPRFSRQITFWDDFVLERPGIETQYMLEGKNVVLFGCGAVGGGIIEILVRAGIKNIVLVDYKSLSKSHAARHFYYNYENLGKPKVDVLSEFLSSIDSRVTITKYFDKLIPTTNLSSIIPDDTDLIINTCDEPYIGHTSLKLGRYAQARAIPLYVSGGFDAHLMSSGELIFPPHTPCIDCAQNTFSNALKGWNPVYSIVNNPQLELSKSIYDNYIPGGPGGLAMMNGFSANLSCMKIVHFLLNDSAFSYVNNRYEYLPNEGKMTNFELVKQSGCKICNE